MKHSLQVFKTEHMTLQFFKDNGFLFMPKKIIIASSLLLRKRKQTTQLLTKKTNIVTIPLNLVLKKFLEMPRVFDKIISFMKSCTDCSVIKSITQGTIWKSLDINAENIKIPLTFYFDEVEVNNPLGSHKGINKIGTVYCTISCLPPEYASMLENIFLLQIHKYTDHKCFGNDRIFHNIVQQITDLENNGLIINVCGREYKIFFSLTYIAGDNLGLNSILGFNKSFNSMYSCRICTTSKTELHKQFVENAQLIRKIEDYSEHCSKKIFGVQELCIFNKIPAFHLLKNLSVDPMHDLLEGVCRYDIGKILNNFINVEKFFTLQHLNNRLSNYERISCDSNITPILQTEPIRNELLILSASEMLFLVNNLCLLIGNLIPMQNKFWKLYLLLRKIVCITCTLDSLTSDTHRLLEICIKQYLKLNIDLFGNHLKPKHHNLIHYSRMIEKYGPLKNLSCMRFEAKHKQVIAYSKTMSSRTNIAYSLALKRQLKLCYRFVCNEGFGNRISHGATIGNFSDTKERLYLKSSISFTKYKSFQCFNWIQLNGTRYEINNIIRTNKITDNGPIAFGKINVIMLDCNNQKVYFVYTHFLIVGYSKHLTAYELELTKKIEYESQDNLKNYKTFITHLLDAKIYVAKNYF